MATPYTYDQVIAALKAEGLVVHQYTGARDRCRCHTGSHAAGGTKVRPWGPFYGTYTHITAGNLGTRTVEQYIRDIINGDPNTPCKAQFVVPPDGSVWVNSVGRANHAGNVSSTSVAMQQAASFSFDKNYDPHRGHDADGNIHSYGIEAIAATAMNPAQREACVRINAALARPKGWDGGESVGHGECSDQRSYADPNLDMGKFRRDVRTRIAGTPAVEPAPTTTFKVMLLPTAGYNANTAPGVTRWKSNTDGLAALVNKHLPDLVGTTEMSNRDIDPMLPRFIAALPLYARELGGTDGRYWFRRKATTEHIASGHVVASDISELDDDDKQAAWTVSTKDGLRVQAIVAHTENQDGVDRTSGINADDLRVTQALSLLSRALAVGEQYKPDHIIYVGDFNSESMVKNTMIARGWKAIGPGYFTRWDDSVKTPCDWGFVKHGATTFERINHAFSDHTALLIRWTLPR